MHVFKRAMKDKRKLSQCSLYYFFWGNEGAESLTSKKFFRDKKVIVGFHNVDLYSPIVIMENISLFKKDIIENATILAPATEDGIKELPKNYENVAKKCTVKELVLKNLIGPLSVRVNKITDFNYFKFKCREKNKLNGRDLKLFKSSISLDTYWR